MKKFNTRAFAASLFVMGIASASSWSQEVTTFDYTGDVQEYVVPPGVTKIFIEAFGAEGGTNRNDSTSSCFIGGLGGMAEGELAVTPGETLSIYVGGRGYAGDVGGWNGGGGACDNILTCAKGGGASDVRQGGVDFSDRMIVAGGGGGAEWSVCNGSAGDGGGLIGTGGSEFGLGGRNGGAGTQVAGGVGGDGGYDGMPGVFGLGGDSGEHPAGHAGSGGGGWYGGGGSSEDGHAGGGSSYIGGVTDSATSGGVRNGNGQIIITELCLGLTVTVSTEELCLGETFTLDGSGVGSVTWDGGVVNGEPFTTVDAGIFTYNATSDSDEDCGYSVEIEVHALPEVTASVDDAEICFQDTVVFTSGGTADSYSWDMGVVDGELTVLTETTTFTVTGTSDETGCSNTATIEVIVNDLPSVIANASDDAICLGDEVTLTGSGDGTSYDWTPAPAEDGVAFEPTETGSTLYTVTGTDDNGCVNTDTISVAVYDAIVITVESTTDEISGADGEIDITVTGGNPAYTFDWDNDETGDFDDTEDLTGLEGGTYTIVVQDEAGCSSSETVTVSSQLSVEEFNSSNVNLYPNPTTNNIIIEVEGQFNYTLFDATGKIILSGNAMGQEKLMLEELPAGVYLVQIQNEQNTEVVRVVKK